MSKPEQPSKAAANEALWSAARDGSIDGVVAALAAGAELDGHTDFEDPAIHQAAGAGQLAVVRLLLDKGADPGVKGGADFTALHLAAREGHTEVVALLLARKPPTERVIDDVLTVATMSRSGRPEIVELLRHARLGSVAPAPRGMNDANAKLVQAAHDGDLAAVRAALAAGADVKATDDRGMQAISWAALRGHAAVLTALLDAGTPPDLLNGVGWPPLGQAAGQGKLDAVAVLLARGADPSIAFDGGRTPLMCASYEGHVEVVKALLAAGADAKAREESQGMTAAKLAEGQGHAEIVALLTR